MPLIDVILVLIIFFVITTTFDSRSMPQLLPEARMAVAAQTKTLSVLVNADGHYFVDEHEVLRTDVDALKQTIAQVAGDDRSRPVLLRARRTRTHQAVVTAYDAGVSFQIATAPEVKR